MGQPHVLPNLVQYMDELKTNSWEESYNNKENYIFYPQIEVVKFLNRFVRKRIGINEFQEILSQNSADLVALDFGCGIGRNTLLFEEFNILGYGVDLSSNAFLQPKL